MEDFFLPAAGSRDRHDGSLGAPGGQGNYWGSIQASDGLGSRWYFDANLSIDGNWYKAVAFPVRCVR